jgi:hypothetical protein
LERYCDEDKVDGDAEADPHCSILESGLGRRRRGMGELTPAENIIVYTIRRVNTPKKIAVERFASNPPRYTHSEHKADDKRAEAINTKSEFLEMCRYCTSSVKYRSERLFLVLTNMQKTVAHRHFYTARHNVVSSPSKHKLCSVSMVSV